MYRLIAAFFVILCLASCENPSSTAVKDGYSVTGEALNFAPNTKVFLEFIEGGTKPIVIDTASIDENGKFTMNGKAEQTGIGRFRIGRTSMLTVLKNAPYTVFADRGNAQANTIGGNREATDMNNLVSKIQSRQATPTFLKAFADTCKSPYLAYMAVNNLKAADHYETYKNLASRLNRELPGSKLAQGFAKKVTAEKANVEAGKKTAIGALAPEINSPTAEGKSLTLSSLRGKVVLVDFWASWCGPCRRENPRVVNAYKEYKNKGFEVFSVSLDSNKDRWLKAIEKDQLIWPSHVSELKKWNSAAAAAYGVRSIPATFLLDRDGKIIGKNLRGQALDNKLAELFAS